MELVNSNGARMNLTWMVLVLSTGALIYAYPDQAGVLLSKLNRVALGAVLGIALDRMIFWYARPSVKQPDNNWMMRRTVLIVGVALAAALAV